MKKTLLIATIALSSIINAEEYKDIEAKTFYDFTDFLEGTGMEYKTYKNFPMAKDYDSLYAFDLAIEKHEEDCIKKLDLGSNFSRLQYACLIGLDMWDRELNAAYQELYSLYNEEEKKDLKENQLLWIQLKENIYKLERPIFKDLEGTMASVVPYLYLNETLKYMTRDRTMQLIRYLNKYKNIYDLYD